MQIDSSFRKLHRFAALFAGVILCILGLSGSILVFRPELERLARPELYAVRPGNTAAKLGDLQPIATAAAPGLDLYRVRLPHTPSASVEFIFGTSGKLTHRVYIEPYQRAVLGIRTSNSDPFLWLQSLHFDLLAAETGRKVNGAVAATLLVIAASGLMMWLRSTASWSARLRPRWRARAARRNWSLHMALGFWSLPLLLLTGSTALYFAFHEPVANFVYAVTRSAPPAPLPKVTSKPAAVPFDDLLHEARKLEPTAEFTLIRLPRAAGQPATVNYVLPGDLSDLGANAIHFDPNTGTALRVARIRDMDIGPRIVAAFVPLHFGTFGGTPTRVLWALLGTLPSALFITGLTIWWRRRSRRSLSEALSPESRYPESLMEARKS